MEEEKEVIEQEFLIALDNIVSKIKGQTATAIVCSEQPMILLFKKLIFKLEELEKENKELKEELEPIKKLNIPVEILVTEFERLEDIEDRKVQIEYDLVFNKGVNHMKFKIEDKIKELEKKAFTIYDSAGEHFDAVSISCVKRIIGGII